MNGSLVLVYVRRMLVFALVAIATTTSAQAGPRDTRRPRVAYATENPAIVISNPAAQRVDGVPLGIEGTARDDRRIKDLEVIWLHCVNQSETSCTGFPVNEGPAQIEPDPTLDCNATRRACMWFAPAPSFPGSYWFVAIATDAAGNESTRSGILSVTVV